MNISTVHTFKTVGINPVEITVETSVTNGIGIHLVGLADAAVTESLLRTMTALDAQGFHVPGKKIVINLAPADLHKTGTGYDLPIAIGILTATGRINPKHLNNYIIAGELSLKGQVRDVPSYVQAALLAKETGRACILPSRSASLAARALGNTVKIYGVKNLLDTISIINSDAPETDACRQNEKETLREDNQWDSTPGHENEKRALEVAAAGGHPILMMGVPGSGKNTLAKIIREILPPMNENEALDVQRIYSVAGREIEPGTRPFRAPHSSSSISALLGGGAGDAVLPGEVSLAHNGILFLDDFADMPKSVKDVLRVPIEDKKVKLSRLRNTCEYPASFLLVAATNPCPCGYYGDGERCTCTPNQRNIYLSHLQGPVMDHITMQLWVHPENNKTEKSGDPCAAVRERVAKARERQIQRQGKLNDELSANEIETLMAPDDANEREALTEFAGNIMYRLNLSVRAYSRILKMARTIADIEGYKNVLPRHIAEAAAYRFLDRNSEATK